MKKILLVLLATTLLCCSSSSSRSSSSKIYPIATLCTTQDTYFGYIYMYEGKKYILNYNGGILQIH